MDDAASIVPGVQQGEVLAGKYRIERVLGQGGMGVVVAARHLHLDEQVAIKFLLPHAVQNAEAVARFAREARAAVKIKSEHVARVSDVGTLENGAPYMVMEYLDGKDLGALLQQSGPLPVGQVVELLLQACEAIAEAHLLGIVHRDLKPANLFVVRRADGLLAVKVLDFGISKVTGTTGLDGGITNMGSVLGSPLYMSPEQMKSAHSADAQSDIWALGVILYELVGGRPPYFADSLAGLCVQILSNPPQPLTTIRPGLPPAIDQVIERCLAKDRTMRYTNIADLAIDLAPLAPERARASVERIMRTVPGARQRPRASTTELIVGPPHLQRASGAPFRSAPPFEVGNGPNPIAQMGGGTGPIARTGGAWSHTNGPPARHRSWHATWIAGGGAAAIAVVGAAIWWSAGDTRAIGNESPSAASVKVAGEPVVPPSGSGLGASRVTNAVAKAPSPTAVVQVVSATGTDAGSRATESQGNVGMGNDPRVGATTKREGSPASLKSEGNHGGPTSKLSARPQVQPAKRPDPSPPVYHPDPSPPAHRPTPGEDLFDEPK